jgi:hypothetical protein
MICSCSQMSSFLSAFTLEVSPTRKEEQMDVICSYRQSLAPASAGLHAHSDTFWFWSRRRDQSFEEVKKFLPLQYSSLRLTMEFIFKQCKHLLPYSVSGNYIHIHS